MTNKSLIKDLHDTLSENVKLKNKINKLKEKILFFKEEMSELNVINYTLERLNNKLKNCHNCARYYNEKLCCKKLHLIVCEDWKLKDD